MNTAIQIEQWPIARLIPRATNPRTHTPEQVAQIAAAIREFGWTNPILVGADDDIIAGHARLMAARKLRLTEGPGNPAWAFVGSAAASTRNRRQPAGPEFWLGRGTPAG